MSEVEVNGLTLKVTASKAQAGVEELGKLADNLSKLRFTKKRLENLEEFSKSIGRFAKAINSVNIKDTGIAEVANTLSGINFSKSKSANMSAYAENLNKFATAVNAVDASKVSGFATALGELSNVKAISKAKSTNLTTFSESLGAFINAVNTLDTQKISGLSEALASIASFKFEANGGKALRSVTKLADGLKELDFAKIKEEATALNDALSPLAKTMNDIAVATKGMGFSTQLGRGLSRAASALREEEEKRRKSETTVNPEDQAKNTVSGLERLKVTLDKMYDVSGFGKLHDAIAKTKEKVSALKETLAQTKFGKAFKEAEEAAQKFFAVLKKGLAIAGNIGKAMANISFLNPFKNIGNTIGSVIKKLQGLGSSLARIAMYRALRTAIKEITKAVKEGLTNLYQWSKLTGGDFAPAVDQLATAMLYLKNSIGAAVSPLITYFAPAIDLAVDKIVDLINVVNQLFARLTGRATWTRALKYPTEFAESAAGASKKVKDNIQSFDELHILRTPNGGSGASAQDYSKMFEETEFSQGLTDWILNFKAAIKEGRWYEAGSILADEINNMINKVDWKKLGSNLGDKITTMFQFAFGFLKNVDFVNIGSSLANFLNGAIDHIDANLVGQTFARKWTMIVDFLYGYVTTFDFPAFGWKISEFVQGWFEELDGAKIGTTISEAIKGVLDMAISFMSNDAMWTEFVEDIAGILNNIDWYGILTKALTLGSKIISAIGTVIRTAIMGGQDASTSIADSYYQAISRQAGSSSVASRITSEMRSANGYTSTFGDQLVGALADSVTNANSEPLVNGIQRLLEALGKVLVDLVKSLGKTVGEKFWENFFDAVQGWHYDEMGNKVSAEDHFSIGGATREGSTEVVEDTVEDVQSFVNTIWNKINGDYNEATAYGATGISGFQQVWDATMVKNAQRSVKAYNNTLSKTGTIIRSVGTDGKKSFDTLNSSIKDFSVTSKNGLASVTDSAVLFGDKMSNDVVSKVMQSKNAISATITSLSEDTKFRMSDMTNTVIGSIANADKAIVTPMANIKNTITNGFKEAGTESIKAINEMGSKMSGALDGAISASKESVSGYKGVWDGLKGSVKDTSNSVIAGSESMANGVTDAFNGIIRNLKNFRVKIPDIGDNKDAGKEFNFSNLKELEKISIPRLAKGGIVGSPTTALIGEAGAEAVVPLENNTGWIDMVAEKISGDGEELALLREEVNLLRTIAGKSFTISSRELFNAVREENADYITMTGKNALVM